MKRHKLQQWTILAKDNGPYEVAKTCSQCGHAFVLEQNANPYFFAGKCPFCEQREEMYIRFYIK